MHKLYEYIDGELTDIERKAASGRLSNTDLQRGDMLAHFKKSLLTNDAMEEGYSGNYSDRRGYSNVDYRNEGNRMPRNNSYGDESYARGRGDNAPRDRMGRYSGDADKDEMVEKIYEVMDRVPDMHARDVLKQVAKGLEKI